MHEMSRALGVPGPLDALALWLLAGALVILLGLVAVRFSARSGMPSLVLYLGIGLALGNGGIGISFDNLLLTEVLGYAALVLILTEGGITTDWRAVRRSAGPALSLATVAVLASVGVVAAAAHLVLGLSWQVSLIVGAVLTSTDAAAVFSVLRNIPLPRKVAGILEMESGLNDPPVVILVTVFAAQAAGLGSGDPWWLIGLTAIMELVGGVAIGLLVGYLGAKILGRLVVGSSTLFAIGVISVSVGAYGAADLVHTSGFAACFVASLLLGNLGLPHRPSVTGFATALGWLAQIGLFVLLGLLANPFEFGAQVIPALVLGVILLLVARPISVFLSCTPFRVPWRHQLFLSWAGLRGAVPVVLATVPTAMGAPGLDWLFDLVFVLVLVFTIVQAPTLPWVARRLGIVQSHHQVDLQVEATPLDELDAEILEVHIGHGSKLAGVQVHELRLPRECNVALVVRDGHSFVPGPTTLLRRDDQL
ncbi:MAG TPA: potassium/proton antiporter, partial [Phycicoccus sp.]|nr:potassium/proton antiporter [Phycicoccus sp.]